MKAAILSPAGFSISEEPLPSIAHDQLLIKTLACGICSGDVFVYRNRAELAGSHSKLGHEASGEVISVGKRVTGFQPGDIVTALASPAYAETFVATAEQLVLLPSDIDPLYAMGEPVACCVHAAGRFGIRPGDSVALIGCGFMGLICLQLAREQGAGFICAIDPMPERRDFSLRLGADVAHDPAVDSSEDLLRRYGEFDVVIEAAGVQSAVDQCTALVAQHGRIVLIGYHQSNQGRRTVDMQQWNFKAIDVINGHVRRQDEKLEAMRRGVELMQQGRLVTEPLVTIYEFSQIEPAFAALASGTPDLFKVVLRMGE